MIGIYIKGDFLDLLPSTTVAIRRRHNLFDGRDPSIKRGSYTLPINVPLTDKNKRLLEHPHRLDNNNKLLLDEEVHLYISNNLNVGIPYLSGQLYISECNEKTARVSVVTKALADFGDLTFDDLDLGNTTQPSPTDMRNHAMTTAGLPDDYNYIFFPVINYDFIEDRERFKAEQFTQNYWNQQTTIFGDSAEKVQIVTPFLKVTWLLQKMFEHIGITLINDIESHPEFKYIYLHHVRNLFEKGQWPTEIKFNDLTPEMKLSDFYKQYAALLFLGIFPNVNDQSVHLKPWKEVLSAAPRHNWTDKIRPNPTIKNTPYTPKSIGFGADDKDSFLSNDENTFHSIDYTLYSNEVYGHPTDFNNYYYNIAEAVFHDPGYTSNGRRFRPEHGFFVRTETGGINDSILNDMIPVLQRQNVDFRTPQGDIYDSDGGHPRIDKRGHHITWIYNESGDPVNSEGDTQIDGVNIEEYSEDHDFTITTERAKNARVLLYRGILDIQNDPTRRRPYAGVTSYDPRTIGSEFEYSLLMDRPTGLAAKMGAEAIEFIKNHKPVEMLIDLSINDLINLREEDKIQIDNLQYLVSEIFITIGTRGVIGPARVSLASVI